MDRREAMKVIAGGIGGTALAVAGSSRCAAGGVDTVTTAPVAGGATPGRDGLLFWLQTSLRRVYPASRPQGGFPASIPVARNERVSLQACVRNDGGNTLRVRAAADGLPGIRVRLVGWVPMRNLTADVPRDELEGVGHVPGLVPEPLLPADSVLVGPFSTAAFWVSLHVPPDTRPGPVKVRVSFFVEEERHFPGYGSAGGFRPWSHELQAMLDVRPVVIAARRDFPVTQWISIESIWDYYKIEPYGERFWQLADAYIANLVSHGVDAIYTPIFNGRHEQLARPPQLLRVRRPARDRYEFDFTDVRRWTRCAMQRGARFIEFSHFFTPAPTSAKYPQRIFDRSSTATGEMLFGHDAEATAPASRRFFEQFLPALHRFLEEEKLLDCSLFHCADEADGDEQLDNYRRARAMLRELAPWMRVMDAMSDVRFATERLSDMPIPNITSAPAFTAAGCPAWTYFCCGPRGKYLQRLFDTPLAKLRMAGWLFYRLGAKGFLHWGHNYWYKFCTSEILDPFTDGSTGAWPDMPYGDAFVVYPGPDGPIDSVRWEVFSESLQDYALLQSAGVKPDDQLLAPIRNYADFPKTEEWHSAARAKILGAG